MFYSHTFLARKGPLGTVWCAAHLQHKLKKSHYASTDIPSTVERIIYPEVPIALRMSGHLLLGVVRIYSKKVEYLHHDCNVLCVSLRNAFRHVDVNLPENANQAQFNAVTLPETYALDAIDLHDDMYLIDGSQDDHHKSQEDITLQEQYHSERELYVRITFDDDIIPGTMDTEHREESDPMQIDIPPEAPTPPIPSPDNRNGEGPNQSEEHGRPEGEIVPPFEVMRDATDYDVHVHSPILRPHKENVDPNINISPPKDTTEKEIDTPPSIPMPSHEPLQYSGPSSPPTEVHVDTDSHANVPSTALALRPSPPPEQPQPRQRNRKRKQLFDESLVLTNEALKNALNDCSDLVKKKKKLPCSALELWRFSEKKKKNEEVFSEPLISGMGANLQNLLSKDLKISHLKLPVTEEAQLESRVAESPAHTPNVGDEIERLRSADREPGHNIEQFLPSSPLLMSPQPQTAATSSSTMVPSSVSEPRFGTTDTQSDMGMYTRSAATEIETPILNFEDRDDDGGTAPSDIPESRASMKADELSFLELDNNSPTDSQGAQTGGTMSARTRAVAQFLKNHSPVSNFTDGSVNLNLSTILEGRQRKLCARMFYETLVLKDCGLIDVQQDEPYGDIILKLTPTMSKAQL
ncbi:sister chromatid cohesion 1 protein 3-like isoform X1 [Chenopodium quinoa]|uniref:Sister chromatid cohesion 1 protein 3 n=1 Tax=Chenopodium quinoa TaxID=63459 RepID=A0A803LNU3_CHEQI|nr:sister chromatid cohesion 1 protein 3-like isoform X1 [Chenopodium quinoa]